MYNTGCLIFAHSILSTPVTSAVVRAPLRMMARWQSRAGMSLEFTPPLLHSQSQLETSNAITTSSSSQFLLGLLWLMLWVVIIILILWSPIKIVSISRLSPLACIYFSDPIPSVPLPMNVRLVHPMRCYARPDPDAVLLVMTSPVHGMMCCDWSYFNRGVPCALFVSHSKMCLWMDWKRISPVDLNGCDQVY